jgi:ribokinase
VALINIGRDGQNNIVAVPGANGKVSGRDVRRNTALLRKAGMILAQLEIPLDAMEALAGFARKNDIPLMLDPARRANCLRICCAAQHGSLPMRAKRVFCAV